jgi:hypothetical protein
MHEVLNIDENKNRIKYKRKQKLIAQFAFKSQDKSFKYS